jgi:hypothetical protein
MEWTSLARTMTPAANYDWTAPNIGATFTRETPRLAYNQAAIKKARSKFTK